MAQVDRAFAKQLAMARKGPVNFAAVPGKTENALLLSRKPIPPGKVKLAREEVGGTKVYRGRCFLEEGVLVFEMVGEGPGDLARRIRETIKEKAGLSMRVEVRAVEEVAEIDQEEGPETEAEGDDAEPADASPPSAGAIPEPPPMPAPMAAEGRFAAQLRTSRAVYDRLKAADPGRARPLETYLFQAAAHAKAGRYDEGTALLEELEALSTSALRAIEPGGPAVAPTAAGVAANPAASWDAGVAAITPALKAALTAGGEAAQELKLRFSEANVFARKAEYPKALELLATVEALLKRAAAPPAAAQAGPAGQGAPRADGGQVAFAKIKLQWNQAKQAVKDQLAQLGTIIVAEDDDPETADAVRKLDRVLKRFNEGLADTLDDLYNQAVPADQPKHLQKAGRIVADYLNYIESDPLIAHVEDNPYKPVMVRRLLLLPLKGLQDKLAAAG